MEFRDQMSYPPAAHPHINLYQHPHQEQPHLLYQSQSSSSSYLPNPNPNAIHGVVNPLPSSVVSGLLQTQAAGQYPHDPYASQQPAALDYYYQLQQLYAANPLAYAPAPVRAGNTIVDLETKKRKIIEGGTRADAVRVCTICNVVCNSDKVFVSHLAGEKHALKARGAVLNVAKPKVPTYVKELYIAKKAAKKASQGLVTFVTSSYCDVCKIDCNSVEVLNNHKLGKKHLKNLQKLQQSLIGPKPSNPTAAAAAAAATATTNLAQNEQQQQQKQNIPAKPKENLEVKKLKVLSGGAAAAAVKVCTFCNVVCNSEMVYRYHISGKKHIAMMKQHGASVS